MNEDLINYLSGFVQQGRLENFERVLEFRTRYINMVCEDIYQSHNASALMRTCDCFGIQDFHIIENRNLFEVNHEIALGASKWLTIKRYNASERSNKNIFEDLRSQGYRIVATTPHNKGVSLGELDLKEGPVSLLFGTEKEGLSSAMLEEADEYVSIDMYGFTESFNVSVSAGIILHWLRMKLFEKGINWHLNHNEKQRLKLDWLRTSIKHSELLEKDFLRKSNKL